jgi:pimeloyl-ACP methyl ester carboxylesterase
MLTRSTITINNNECSYYRGGQGRPLLFLHGFTTEPGFKFAESWCANFDVIIPYHPGFGTSGDAPVSDDLHDLVMHHVEFIDHLGLKAVHLVGHSLGGHIAARIASEHPRYVESVVLACPTGLRVNGEQPADIIALPPAELADRLFAAPIAVDQRTTSASQVVARYREASSVARLMWTRPFDRKLNRYLHRITAPALILWGEKDRIVPAANANSWQALLPKARVELLPALGHMLFNESAEPAVVVERFLGQDTLERASHA